jgi:hypothetical protein
MPFVVLFWACRMSQNSIAIYILTYIYHFVKFFTTQASF